MRATAYRGQRQKSPHHPPVPPARVPRIDEGPLSRRRGETAGFTASKVLIIVRRRIRKVTFTGHRPLDDIAFCHPILTRRRVSPLTNSNYRRVRRACSRQTHCTPLALVVRQPNLHKLLAVKDAEMVAVAPSWTDKCARLVYHPQPAVVCFKYVMEARIQSEMRRLRLLAEVCKAHRLGRLEVS